jgi:hypothetical protein
MKTMRHPPPRRHHSMGSSRGYLTAVDRVWVSAHTLSPCNHGLNESFSQSERFGLEILVRRMPARTAAVRRD